LFVLDAATPAHHLNQVAVSHRDRRGGAAEKLAVTAAVISLLFAFGFGKKVRSSKSLGRRGNDFDENNETAAPVRLSRNAVAAICRMVSAGLFA